MTERNFVLRKIYFSLFLLLNSLVFTQTITVLTHDSFSISKAIIDDFTKQTGIRVRFLQGGDAGEVTSKAILTKHRPLADLFYGIDNSLIARALKAGIFEPYESPLLEHIPQSYALDFKGFATPIDIGFVNFNLDKAWFLDSNLELPTDISQLTEERYKGLTVVENPVSSSPGLAFMLATIIKFGEDWLNYWADLRDNDLLVSEGWTEAYYTAFTHYGGDRPIVLSYASSPAAEVIFAETELTSAPTFNLFCELCVYRQVEAIGILRGTKQLEAAKTFIDYMLGLKFQEDIPLNMFVYPVNPDAKIPESFTTYSQVPSENEVASLKAGTIEENLANWLESWVRVVMQGQNP